MAVLTNTMMQGTAAVSDEEDYQIEKSVRLPREDDSWFTRELDQDGNRCTWTWAAWVKKHATKASEYEYIWGYNNPNGQHGEQIRFQDTGEIWWYQYDNDGSNYSYRLATNAKYRDPTAWLHIVAAFDSTNAKASERMKLYVNGVRITSFAHNDNPARNLQSSAINRTGYQQALGRIGHSGSGIYNANCSLADVQFIEGLQLSADAFGSFDSTGAWNPKAFAVPTPNTGATYSGGTVTGSNTNSGGGPAQAFDGSLSSAHWRTNNSEAQKLAFASAITVSSSINFYCKGDGNQPFSYWMDGTEYTVDPTAELGANTEGWVQRIGAGSFEAVEVSSNSGGNRSRLLGIEVDGGLLVDGKTDQSYAAWKTAQAINDGRDWGSGAFQKATNGGSLSAWTGAHESAGFSGHIAADASPPQEGNIAGVAGASVNNATIKWTVPGAPIQGTNFKLCCYQPQGTAGITNTLSINGATAIPDTDYDGVSANEVGWTANIAIPEGGLTSLEMYFAYSGGHSWFGWYAIQVDGVVLVSSQNNNSYHLKFNDTTVNSKVGKDALNGKIADATGGKPLYNTTDAYGDVKGSGYRADSNKANLVFAVPGDTITDVSNHADLRNSGSAKTITNSNAAVKTDQSRFYGSSIYLGAKHENKHFYVTPANGGTDIDFGTSSFCFECWHRSNGSGHNSAGMSPIIETSYDDTGLTGWIMLFYGGDHLKFYYINAAGNAAVEETVDTNADLNDVGNWVHHAVTHDSSTNKLRVFKNGILRLEKSSGDFKADWTSTSGLYFGKQNFSGDTARYGKGEISDIRVYKGAAVYTSNFKPPTRSDWTVHRVSHASNPGFEFGHNYDNYEFDSGWTSKAYDCTGSNIDAWEDMSTPKVMNLPGSGNQNSLRVYRTKDGSKRRWTLTTENSGGGSTGISAVGVSNDGINWTAPSGDQECGSGYTTAPGAWMTHAGGAWSKLTVSWTNDAITEVDVLPDSPTNYEDDSGGIHGNYATLNENQKHNGITLKQGNLAVHASTGNLWKYTKSTIGMKTGKWYCEMGPNLYKDSNNHCQPGISVYNDPNTTSLASASGHVLYHYGGNLYLNNSDTGAFGAAWSSSSFNETGIIGIAFDADTRKVWFSKDGVWQDSGNPSAGSNEAGVLDLVGDGIYAFTLGTYGGLSGDVPVNFGANGFKYTVPTGFKALCTQNLDDTFSGTEVNNPSKYFDIKLWSGDGIDGKGVRGWNFGPDFLWMKSRNTDISNFLQDIVRGTGKALDSDNSDKESTGTGYVESFESDGFDLEGSGGGNTSGRTYVAWGWDAGTAASGANNDGATNVSSGNQWVNASAGFSITKYSGGSGTTTVGHGLSAKPDFVIVKCLGPTDSQHWTVWHNILDDGDYLRLNDDSAAIDYAMFNDGQPTNTVVPLGNDGQVSNSGDDYIMYAWTAIKGYSAFSSYTGTAAADGPFVYCGFRPRWVMVKNIDAGGPSNSGRNWVIRDTARDDDNPVKNYILADATNGGYTYEGSSNERFIDITANGFKVRSAVGAGDAQYTPNVNGNKYLVAAFAEHPFKTARAR